VRRARDVLGASHHLRLATEEELQHVPAFELGALPPFGTAPLPELVDVSLLRHERILCAGGEQRRSVLIAALDLLRVTEPEWPTSASTPKTGSRPASSPPHEHFSPWLATLGRRGVAVTHILLAAGVRDIVGCDRLGAVYRGRPGLSGMKGDYAALTNPRDLHGRGPTRRSRVPTCSSACRSWARFPSRASGGWPSAQSS
jgi:Aminoacyl-tRNA editing domain